MGPAGFEPRSHPSGMLREAGALAGVLPPERTPVKPSDANGGLRPTGYRFYSYWATHWIALSGKIVPPAGSAECFSHVVNLLKLLILLIHNNGSRRWWTSIRVQVDLALFGSEPARQAGVSENDQLLDV